MLLIWDAIIVGLLTLWPSSSSRFITKEPHLLQVLHTNVKLKNKIKFLCSSERAKQTSFHSAFGITHIITAWSCICPLPFAWWLWTHHATSWGPFVSETFPFEFIFILAIRTSQFHNAEGVKQFLKRSSNHISDAPMQPQMIPFLA